MFLKNSYSPHILRYFRVDDFCSNTSPFTKFWISGTVNGRSLHPRAVCLHMLGHVRTQDVGNPHLQIESAEDGIPGRIRGDRIPPPFKRPCSWPFGRGPTRSLGDEN